MLKKIFTGALFATALLLAYPASAQEKLITVSSVKGSMTYHLVHPLHKIESTSTDAKFKATIDPADKSIMRASGDVDVTTFSSGNSNRDSHAMEVIDAIDYPDAQFTSGAISQTGDSLQIAGKLTFHGVTKDVQITAHPVWTQHSLVITGGFTVSLAAYNIERPSLLMIPVEDALSFEFSTEFDF